tara:strand:- start:477 stop:1043 length:567 start_codon:yes stop_codon:yes gene_type:complete
MTHTLDKKRFTEQFFIKTKIDDISFVNTRLIKNHILANFMMKNRYKDEQYWFMKEYIKVPYHQHIQWTQDWLRDHYRIEHGQTLVPTPVDSIRGIIQQTGENVSTHHNVKDWHLADSPEVSCLYTVSTGPKDSFIVFEYDDGRNKHRRWKVPLEQDHIILFSSHIPFYITKNENKDFLVNLSLHFQLI